MNKDTKNILLIGALGVGGYFAYNWWQKRQAAQAEETMYNPDGTPSGGSGVHIRWGVTGGTSPCGPCNAGTPEEEPIEMAPTDTTDNTIVTQGGPEGSQTISYTPSEEKLTRTEALEAARWYARAAAPPIPAGMRRVTLPPIPSRYTRYKTPPIANPPTQAQRLATQAARWQARAAAAPSVTLPPIPSRYTRYKTPPIANPPTQAQRLATEAARWQAMAAAAPTRQIQRQTTEAARWNARAREGAQAATRANMPKVTLPPVPSRYRTYKTPPIANPPTQAQRLATEAARWQARAAAGGGGRTIADAYRGPSVFTQ